MKLKKFIFKSVTSTNDKAIKIIKNSNTKFGIVVSEDQKKGRGQYGKKWVSYKGNLFVSIFFLLKNDKSSLKKKTKINCYLIKKLIAKYYKSRITIKLPNDLLIKKKKICGILQETIIKANVQYMIVGIGLNLIKNPKFENYPTTNLSAITNKHIDNKIITLELKKIYEKFIPKFPRLNLKIINRV